MTTAHFDPQPILEDLQEFHDLVAAFWGDLADDVWGLRTGTRDKDWTLHQTLAHLVSVARMFNLAADAAAHDRVAHVPGLARRDDLPRWNEAQIATLSQTPPGQLVDELLGELSRALDLTASLTADRANRTIFARVYNRPGRAIDFIEWQLSHAGIIHAAQVTRPLDQPPLWERYSPGFLHRQIDRFMRHMSVAYWQNLAGDLHAVMNFHVGTEQGGDWHIWLASDGGRSGKGAVEDAAYSLHFDSPYTLFGVFTVHIPFPDPIAAGKLRIEGDLTETLQALRLFSATPPKS